jgi:hypothetical protein
MRRSSVPFMRARAFLVMRISRMEVSVQRASSIQLETLIYESLIYVR